MLFCLDVHQTAADRISHAVKKQSQARRQNKAKAFTPRENRVITQIAKEWNIEVGELSANERRVIADFAALKRQKSNAL